MITLMTPNKTEQQDPKLKLQMGTENCYSTLKGFSVHVHLHLMRIIIPLKEYVVYLHTQQA